MSIEWLLIKKNEIKAQNMPSEIEFRCDCGNKGNLANDKTDFKLLGQDRKGFTYFECLKCKRHLRYNHSTGNIKLKKGVFRFTPLRSRRS